MTAQSQNSKLIIAAQRIYNEISIVREWLLAGKFPACIQDFAPASYELKAYWVGRKSLYLDICCGEIVQQQGRAQLIVPMSLRHTIFNDSHHTTYGGHFGMTHTHTAKSNYTISGLECQISSGIESLHATSASRVNHQ